MARTFDASTVEEALALNINPELFDDQETLETAIELRKVMQETDSE